MESKYSVVEFFHESSGDSCGYCKSSHTNINSGIWAHTLTVEDYQDLVDRGWRRSGQYCYKPSMRTTCCPLYTIKCDALNFKPSKSQKKVLKRVAKFVNEGKTPNFSDNIDDDSEGSADGNISGSNLFDKRMNKIIEEKTGSSVPSILEIDKQSETPTNPPESIKSRLSNYENQVTSDEVQEKESLEHQTIESSQKRAVKNPRPGIGQDPAKPKCKKAKLLRLEKKLNKLSDKNNSTISADKRQTPKEKTFEDFFDETNNENSFNKLELRLVRSSPRSREFEESFLVEHALYQKYQIAIHKDPITKVTEHQFTRFLVTSPLKSKNQTKGPSIGYGSYHQQYWFNGKLIAVGVIDILPKCVSSVYFFYDPDYSCLSLGTYGSLRELALVRTLQKEVPDLKEYYMGYYIHSCPKMRYKARYSPSFLLCPEVYTWHPVGDCQLKLDNFKYSRFNDDLDAICEDSSINLNKVMVLWKQIAMPYASYKMRAKNAGPTEDEEVTQYAELVGRQCAERMLLYRS